MKKQKNMFIKCIKIIIGIKEKKLLSTIKDWSDYIKNNNEQIADNLSKKYEELPFIYFFLIMDNKFLFYIIKIYV